MSSSPATRPGRRARLSREQIARAAVATLDRAGADGLTLRGLAEELGAGLGSVYYHVSGRAALIDLACDELIGRALATAESAHLDPAEAAESAHLHPGEAGPPMEADLVGADATVTASVAALRRTALALFAELDRHPWMAAHTQLGREELPHGLRLWEALGRPLAEMGLTPRQQFHGSTALAGYVIGVAAQMAAQDDTVDPTLSKDAQLDLLVERWQGRTYDDHPWIRSMAGEFRQHDDRAQFAAGLDLLLVGLVRQAG